MFSGDNLDLKRIATFVVIFGASYIISGLLSPLVADVTVADMWGNVTNGMSKAAASVR